MEITADLPLNINEETLIDLHSILNLMNVATYELMQLETILENGAQIEACIERSTRAAEMLYDPAEAHRLVAGVGTHVREIEAALDDAAKRSAPAHPEVYHQHRRNLASIYGILRVRAAEIQARQANPLAWVRHEVGALRRNFVEVLQAIERNSHGAYRIVNNIAEHEEGRYFVNFEIDSVLGEHLHMPAVFQDVMRDLIANARKYTPPGGRILAGLFFGEQDLRFTVSDNGAGMPPAEIADLVQFGRRGSNVADRPTRGGGFGLTKAYYVTRRFGGRMWIDSEGMPGKGSQIRIILPFPEGGFATSPSAEVDTP
ncbi:MAG: sensor histidine kinase [Opitutales bacterium]|nr:sensor histidine kinase [Opitutales bacterium]